MTSSSRLNRRLSQLRDGIRGDDSGFTLLELLIAMAILMFIAFGIFQATTETYKLRDVLSTEGDFYNRIRLTMNILNRDVMVIFNPILMLPPGAAPSPGPSGSPQNNAQNQAALNQNEMIDAGELGQTYAFWGPALDRTGIRPSRFVGTDKKLTFISLSHMRIYKDSPESEFAKVSYELRPDEPGQPEPGLLTLVKTESSNAFQEEETRDAYLQVYKLLPGIKKLKFRYYRRSTEQWLESWDSEKPETKSIYPDIIELTVEVRGPSKLGFEGIYKFRPEVPLNGLSPSS